MWQCSPISCAPRPQDLSKQKHHKVPREGPPSSKRLKTCPTGLMPSGVTSSASSAAQDRWKWVKEKWPGLDISDSGITVNVYGFKKTFVPASNESVERVGSVANLYLEEAKEYYKQLAVHKKNQGFASLSFFFSGFLSLVPDFSMFIACVAFIVEYLYIYICPGKTWCSSARITVCRCTGIRMR